MYKYIYTQRLLYSLYIHKHLVQLSHAAICYFRNGFYNSILFCWNATDYVQVVYSDRNKRLD
jgi:hypothetical protein